MKIYRFILVASLVAFADIPVSATGATIVIDPVTLANSDAATVDVCADNTLALIDVNGQRLTAEQIALDLAAVQTICQPRVGIFPRAIIGDSNNKRTCLSTSTIAFCPVPGTRWRERAFLADSTGKVILTDDAWATAN